MNPKNKLALIYSYYLSRFDTDALKNLGFNTWNEAYLFASNKLDVNKHSVKNWRDEFDPIHGFRAGWYQRPMSPSRVSVVKALENLEELEIREIIIDIFNSELKEDTPNFKHLINVVENDAGSKDPSGYVLRGQTGKFAEEFFIEHHRKYSAPLSGNLVDTRNLGCGYDFRIENSDQFFVEVKGLSDASGGILFTNKEWEVARKNQDKYFLVIVSQLNTSPKIRFIRNPYSALNPKKNIVRTIQVQWTISSKVLNKDA